MTGELQQAPTDEIGMPLPILQSEVPPGANQAWDDHHGFYTRAAFLDGTEGTRAVRFSRLQYTPRWLHDRFHKFYPDGLDLPPNEYEAFKLAILGYAGYCTRLGVDVSGTEARQVHLTRRQRHELRQPQVFSVERASAIGSFLIAYTLEQGLDNIEPLVDSFLAANTRHEKVERGLTLIEKAAEQALAPFEVVYAAARRQKALREPASDCPQQLLRRLLVKRVPQYPTIIRTKLTSLTS